MLERFIKKEADSVRPFYSLAREIYRSWQSAEGKDTDIIDYNVSGPLTALELRTRNYSKLGREGRRNVSVDIKELLEQMEKVIPAAEEKHNWEFLQAQLNASNFFLKRLVDKRNVDQKEYIEQTMQVEVSKFPEGILDSLQEIVFAKAIDLGIKTPTEENILAWKKDHQLANGHAHRLFIEKGKESVERVSKFLGGKLSFPFSVVSVEEDEYWWVWADSDPKTGEFRFQQNFSEERQKIWTYGKVEELAPHEFGQHAGRMSKRREQIVHEKLHKVFGMTTVHGPEAPVEEGLGVTITHLVPGFYQSLSLEGQFQVDSVIYRHMVYSNAHTMLVENEAPGVVSDYIKTRIPWEPDAEIDKQIRDRTTDPLLETYSYAYGKGAFRFLAYSSALSNEGKLQFLRKIYERPFTMDQVDKLFKSIISNPRHRNPEADLPRGNIFVS